MVDEAVHDRPGSTALPVRGAESLNEGRRRRGRAGCPGAVGAPGCRGTTPDADLVAHGLDGVIGRGEEPEVGGRRHVLARGSELGQPETVEVGLVADDQVADLREVVGDGGRIGRELRACFVGQRCRRGARLVDDHEQADVGGICGCCQASERAGLGRVGLGLAGIPDAGHCECAEAGLGQLVDEAGRVSRSRGVVDHADHELPSGASSASGREEDRSEQSADTCGAACARHPRS